MREVHINPLQNLLDNPWYWMMELEAVGRLVETNTCIAVTDIAKSFTGHMSDRYRSQLVQYEATHDGMPDITRLKKV